MPNVAEPVIETGDSPTPRPTFCSQIAGGSSGSSGTPHGGGRLVSIEPWWYCPCWKSTSIFSVNAPPPAGASSSAAPFHSSPERV